MRAVYNLGPITLIFGLDIATANYAMSFTQLSERYVAYKTRSFC
jgi:hypothetical protein